MSYSLLFLFGIGIGVISGLLGIGGGLLLVPGLMLLFGFSQMEAQGTSLAVLIPPIGIFAALIYYQNDHVRLPVVGWVALGFMVGACVGAMLVDHVPPHALRLAFGALLLYTGFLFVFSSDAGTKRSSAALPGAIAALVTLVVARLIRRPVNRPPAPPAPGADSEYHI